MSGETCTAYWSERGHAYCGEPAIGTLTQSCIHEHVSKRPICTGCAADTQQAAGAMICRPCDEQSGEHGHECTARLVIDWADGTTTVIQEATS
jgi:predicted amidophosphoribosyltransferase